MFHHTTEDILTHKFKVAQHAMEKAMLAVFLMVDRILNKIIHQRNKVITILLVECVRGQAWASHKSGSGPAMSEEGLQLAVEGIWLKKELKA